MTIEEFLGLSADDFARMSDEEIMMHLKPYLAASRPAEGKKFSSKDQIVTTQRTNKRKNMMSMIEGYLKKHGEPT